MSQSASARAGRLHAALSATFEGLHTTVGGASFERRTGHIRLLLPSVPIALFNGVLVESEPCSGVGDSISEVEKRGLPCGVQLREGQHPEVEAEARAIGLTERTPMPGMALAFEELVEAPCDGLEILPVEGERVFSMPLRSRQAVSVLRLRFSTPCTHRSSSNWTG